MPFSVPDLFDKMKPYIITLVGDATVEGSPSPHDLNSAHHSGSLADSQATQFLKTDGSRALTGNLTVSDTITIDGVDISLHASNASAHHTAFAGLKDDAGANVTVDADLRVRLRSGNGLTMTVVAGVMTFNFVASDTSLIVAADGAAVQLATSPGLVIASGLKLNTPDTLSVSSANSVGSGHSHAITASNDPGAASALLKTDASGFLSIRQLTLKYDSSNYAVLGITSGGNLTVTPTGDIVFDPTGNDILPNTNYDLNFGSLTKKYLTIHAAELWVETLVAQDTLATVGGRILVGLTTELTSDLAVAGTTMYVKHNSLANGDVCYMEANGSVEFLKVTSAPGGVGPYSYTITRNLDGTGANDWPAGTAVFDTGTVGTGWIDLYSIKGMRPQYTTSATLLGYMPNRYFPTSYYYFPGRYWQYADDATVSQTVGPTITGNVRNSDVYNDWTEYWSVGNLNGVYGYGTNVYGAAFGKYSSGGSYLTVDATYGVRILRGNDVLSRWYMDGSLVFGQIAADRANVYISDSGVQLRSNTDAVIDLKGVAGSDELIAYFNGKIGIGTSGGIFQGTGTFTNPTTGLKIWNVSGKGIIAGFTNGIQQWKADSDGKLMGAGGLFEVSADYISIDSPLAISFDRNSIPLGFMQAQPYGDSDIELAITATNVVRSQLLGNGSFESDGSEWTESSFEDVVLTMPYATSSARSGAATARFVYSYNPLGGWASLAGTWKPANEGSSHILSFYVKASGVNYQDPISYIYYYNLQARIEYGDAAQNVIATYQANIVSNFDYWSLQTFATRSAPAGTQFVRAHFYGLNTYHASNDSWYVDLDDASLTAVDASSSIVLNGQTGDVLINPRLKVGLTTIPAAAGDMVARGYIDSETGFSRSGSRGLIYVSITPKQMRDTDGITWNAGGSANRNTGTYVFDMQSSDNGSIPAAAKAVYIRISAKQTAGASNYLAARARGGTSDYPVGHIVTSTDYSCGSSGNCPLDDTYRDLEITVGGSNATLCYAIVCGYFI